MAGGCSVTSNKNTHSLSAEGVHIRRRTSGGRRRNSESRNQFLRRFVAAQRSRNYAIGKLKAHSRSIRTRRRTRTQPFLGVVPERRLWWLEDASSRESPEAKRTFKAASRELPRDLRDLWLFGLGRLCSRLCCRSTSSWLTFVSESVGG